MNLAPGSTIDEFPQRAADMSSEMRALEQQTFEVAFESALEELAGGGTVERFCNEYHVRLSPTRFRTWIFRDRRRKQAYEAAKAVGAEAIEDEMLRIADGLTPDGTPALVDIQRSQLMINTRWKMLTVWNRERYGDVRKIEQTTTTRLDPATLSTPELQQRLLHALGVSPSDSNDPLDDDSLDFA